MDITNEIYSKSYKEVVTILSFLPQKDYDKIPSDKIDFYIDNMEKDYKFKYDVTKSIMEQNVLKPTRAILANLFKKYLATPEEKNEITTIEKQEYDAIEAEKRRKYNPDDLFKKNRRNTETIENGTAAETQMVEYKENILQKIFRRIKLIFWHK